MANPTNNIAMKLPNFILSLLIACASLFLCQQIIYNSLANQKNKNDYAELNHIKYGLLNIDVWKRQVTEILAEEINKLYLSKSNERALKKHIEVLLNKLIDDVDKKIRAENSGSPGGVVTQSIINIFINLDVIKQGIPEYADAVIHEMTKPKSERQIKGILNKQLEQYSSQTFDVQDTPQLSEILIRTGSGDIEAARIKIDGEITLKHALIIKEVALLITLSAIIFALYGFRRQAPTFSQCIFLILTLIALLVAGVTTPMIDMEATISQMSFMLMGHPIYFENQVLYFQSKSILDVFWIMITHHDILMKLVGALLVTFSIVFPLLKLISSLGYSYNYLQARQSAVIKFFVLKSGKWSMADVMVVAIFMAYIGFNGIITNQLGKLSSAEQDTVMLTTNGTSLQPGFYLFLTYTLLALVLSGLLTRKPIESLITVPGK